MISPADGFDHESPPTHEEEQAKQPELGAPKPAKAKKAKKGKTPKRAKKAKRAAKMKPAKGKKLKAARKPARKPKAAKKAKPRANTPKRGVPKDGSPRRKPGTNPARSEEAGRYGRRIAKARQAAGLTQKQLAKKVGLSQPGLANIERGVGGAGDSPRGQATRARLEKALGL